MTVNRKADSNMQVKNKKGGKILYMGHVMTHTCNDTLQKKIIEANVWEEKGGF